ncbi:hypothetical protein C8J56DRAFT_892200 [Mycena floridula]|nr:hypothetical protein C8J56DRAFT_892200 [Mycena floridula]
MKPGHVANNDTKPNHPTNPIHPTLQKQEEVSKDTQNCLEQRDEMRCILTPRNDAPPKTRNTTSRIPEESKLPSEEENKISALWHCPSGDIFAVSGDAHIQLRSKATLVNEREAMDERTKRVNEARQDGKREERWRVREKRDKGNRTKGTQQGEDGNGLTDYYDLGHSSMFPTLSVKLVYGISMLNGSINAGGRNRSRRRRRVGGKKHE